MMEPSLRILVVVADPDEAALTARSLERADDAITALEAADADEAVWWSGVSDDPIDCVVCDHDSTGIDGIAVLERVRQNCPDLPFVLFPSDGSEELASRAVSAGVSDYVHRVSDESDYERLVERIRYVTALAREDDTPSSPGNDSSPPLDPQQLVEPDLVGVYVIQELSFEYVDETLASVFGYDRDELLSEVTVPDLVHEDDRACVVETLQKRELRATEEIQSSFKGVRKDGEVVHVEVHGEVVDYGGQPAVTGTLLDVTEAKRREKELERYERMVNAAGDMVYALDSDGRITFVNDTSERVSGYDRETLLGQHVSFLTDEAAIAEGKAIVQELLRDGSSTSASDSYELTLHTADDEVVPCQAHIALLTDSDDFRGTVGVVRDVTERKQLERLLRTERDQFAALFENIPEPTVQYLMKGERVYVQAVNSAFEEVFGYEEEEIAGNSIDEFIVPVGLGDEARALNKRVAAGEQLGVEVRRQTNEGLREFLLRNAPLSTDRDPVKGYVIYTDITAQKRREYELARQNERLDEFAGVVSHDLRNPLGIAQGMLSLARENWDGEDGDVDTNGEDDRRRNSGEYLDTAEYALQRMEAIIDDVLALARQGKVVDTPTATSLEAVVNDSWELAGNDADLLIDGPLAEIEADGERLRRLFENLFRNATEHGGQDVVVTVGMLDGDRGFYVEDDGPGISPDAHRDVFEHGYTTVEDGTGLGLAIVRAIVQAHGWTISVTDGESGGARFEIRGLDDSRLPDNR